MLTSFDKVLHEQGHNGKMWHINLSCSLACLTSRSQCQSSVQVTMVSPKQIAARGVPVYRLVHEEGSFVVTFPNAFHSGFNTGVPC